MADQPGSGDDSGTPGPRGVSMEEFQMWTQRIMSQDHRLEEILRLLRAPPTATPSTPTTSQLPVAQETGTPATAATSTAPTPISAMPETTVAPIAQTGVVLPTQTEVIPSTPSTSLTETPSTPTTPSTKAMPEARQAREFQRHQPEKFYGGMNLEAAEIFLRSHEKIHDILATPAHMQPGISSASLFGEADVWWRTTVATKGKPRDWVEFKGRFEQKYIPHTVRNLKRTEFQNIRQRADESVIQYIDRYLRLMEYAGGAADTDADQAYYFVHGLLDSIGSMVVTTAPSTLQAAYERAMASEGFGSTRTGAQAISSAPSQSGRPSGDGRKRKRFRQWSQRDRAHSVASIASPPTAAVVSSAPARSYASVHHHDPIGPR
ncbi:hypothetical protein Sjap_016012 [Stephania japonica]|uniref:Retrotransposon gag domain-containing protein n=1 Tax=Stephania japonica TaxID=461633 RepID=A0AAP0IKP7_9MAGN